MTLIDGEPAAQLPVSDRGLQYGDGLFETLAVQDGEPRHFARHLRRLAEGCRRLALPMPDAGLLQTEVRRLCVSAPARAVVKLMLTRGSGGRGYAPPAEPNVRRILTLHPWPEYPRSLATQGVRVRLCRTRLGLNPALAGIKHLNRLEQVLARGEWTDPDIREGLMCDQEGRPVEGTMSNLFVLAGQRLSTPPTSGCGISGIMRERVLEHAPALGLSPLVEPLSMQSLSEADEVFLTNTLIGIWPVRELIGLRQFGPPGVWTRRLQEALLEAAP